MVSNTKRLLYKDPPTRGNRHVHRLFTCSNSPNVEARASALLVGTSKQLLLQPYERLQMVMSAVVQPCQGLRPQPNRELKSFTTTHSWSLCNQLISMLLFLLAFDVLSIITHHTLSVCSQPWRQWKRLEWFAVSDYQK